MVPRLRSKARAGWPDNLYPNRDGYKYRHPVTRKETWMGKNKAAAFAAAKKLNALLTPDADLAARVLTPEKTVSDAIKVFRTEDVPGRNWAPKTAENYESVINRIEKGIGTRDLETLSVKDCAEFFRTVTDSPRSRQQFRLVLGWILACAVEEGWTESNPALVTRKIRHERQRGRLTLDAYNAIWEQAPTWVRNAMDLSLLTLLRREDCCMARFTDAHDDALWIIPAKTEDSTLVKLRIELSPDLEALIARCRDDVLSPFLIHRLPEKARPQHMRAEDRSHHTQVLPEQLTRAFKDARDAAKITGKNAPTFHEIRSLGGALLREKGWTVDQVQALMGHGSEAMTKHYLEGHDAPWQSVTTGIALPA
jgi:enterobacteria phage integrase